MKDSPEKPNRLGEMLIRANLLSQGQLKKALEYQQNTGGRLGEILEKLGFIKEDGLIDFLAKQQDLKVIDPMLVVWPDGLIKKVPQSLIEKYNFLPMAKHEDILTIAISDPTDYDAIEEIQLFTNMRVEVVLAHRSKLKKAIDEIFHKQASVVQTKEELIKELEGTTASAPKKNDKDYGLVIDALSQVLVAKQIITEAELNQKISELTRRKPTS